MAQQMCLYDAIEEDFCWVFDAHKNIIAPQSPPGLERSPNAALHFTIQAVTLVRAG
jgi:hypothetical protein